MHLIFYATTWAGHMKHLVEFLDCLTLPTYVVQSSIMHSQIEGSYGNV